MKKSLVFRLVMLMALSLAHLSCEKKEGAASIGVITGFDSRACPCCGGLMINFKGETQPYAGEFYLIQNSPEELGISPDAKFPMMVQVRWTQAYLDFVPCVLGNFIKITSLKKL